MLKCEGFEHVSQKGSHAKYRKVGSPTFDLVLACAVLAASGQLPAECLEGVALFVALSLDGGIRSCQGTLAVAQGSARAGLQRFVLGAERAREAMLIEGVDVAVAGRLTSAVRILKGGEADPLLATSASSSSAERREGVQPKHLLVDPTLRISFANLAGSLDR